MRSSQWLPISKLPFLTGLNDGGVCCLTWLPHLSSSCCRTLLLLGVNVFRKRVLPWTEYQFGQTSDKAPKKVQEGKGAVISATPSPIPILRRFGCRMSSTMVCSSRSAINSD
ncbi:unnamed protein product, partial [Ectocarpus sp. 12 AP-2014]